MSDDAPQYFNAWKSAVCEKTVPRKLLCIWHVLRNWRTQILEKVNKVNVGMAWARLAIILREQTKSAFQELLAKFLTELNEYEPEFGKYFHKKYCSTDNRISEWAFWARKGSVVNVNMYLEAFHRTLKKKFLNRNENNRMDTLLTKLLDAAMWYLLEYMVAQERGGHENNYRIKETHDRHRKADQFQPNDIVLVGDWHWKIKSASKKETEYDIIRVKDRCNCNVQCRYCIVCPDLYDCSCPSAMFGSVACKHVHFICMTLDKKSPTAEVDRHWTGGSTTTTTNQANAEVIGNEEESNRLQEINDCSVSIDPTRFLPATASKAASVIDQRNKAMELWKSIESNLEIVENVDALEEAIKKLSIVDTYLKLHAGNAVPRSSSSSGQKFVHNKKMTIQSRFYQVRKKRKRAADALGRPDDQTITAIRENFEEMESQVCVKCYLEEPPAGADSEEEEVSWVQCEKENCKNWYHSVCANMTETAGIFFCSNCI